MKRQPSIHLCVIFLLMLCAFVEASTAMPDAPAGSASVSDNERSSLIEALRKERGETGGTTTQSRFHLQSKLTASDGAAGDEMGMSVAISGNTAVVGSWHDDIDGRADQGSAYVFVRSSLGAWAFQQKLTASDGDAGDSFGYSVAITSVTAPSQTVIMVGAFGDNIGANANQGSVYVFVRASGGTTWSSQGKLNASDGLTDDAFGNNVAMSGSFAIIGANGCDGTGGLNEGAAYVFVRSGTLWVEEQKIKVGIGGQNFGWSVGISGTTAIIGTNYSTPTGGAAYVFDRASGGNTWSLSSFGIAHDDARYGYKVAISGDLALVGEPLFDNASNLDQGRVWVAKRSGGSAWFEVDELLASDGVSGDKFGSSVAISGTSIIVGAPSDTVGGAPDRGSVYVFLPVGPVSWIESQKLTDLTGGASDLFGWSAAISGDTAIVGAVIDDISPNLDQGSVSVFSFTPSTPFDYDADGRSDISVFRPSNGAWYLNRSTAGFLGMQFGFGTDKIAPADYDGDGKTDIAIYRPSDGVWFIVNSGSGVVEYRVFGLAEDLPAPADYDGDGKADICIFRPSIGTWYRHNSSNGSFFGIQFGSNGDRPTVGDFDGDSKADIGIWRPSNGDWYHIRSSNGTIFGERFGISTDKMVPADYDADGKTDLAVWRPSSGIWYIKQSSNDAYMSYLFGLPTDIPAPGDFDGDGKADRAVFRPSDGTWYITNSTNGSFTIFPWGQSGDRPTPGAFLN